MLEVKFLHVLFNRISDLVLLNSLLLVVSFSVAVTQY